jgi:large subunit ribosomal protein L4
MQVDIYNIEKEKVGSVELPSAVFEVEVSEALLHEQVKAQRASWRRGTHATRTRGDVRGGGAKPYKQKGTGRARQGSTRAPHFVGGGTVFGPHPRDYSYRLPRSARRSALRSALSLRAKQGSLTVLKAFPLEAPRTKLVDQVASRFGWSSALVVDVDNGVLKLSARNLPAVKYIEPEGLNIFDILNHAHLVLTEAALQHVIDRAGSAGKTASEEAA